MCEPRPAASPASPRAAAGAARSCPPRPSSACSPRPSRSGAQAATSALDGGQRNPSNNTSAHYTKETEIVGSIAQNQGGVAANTGGYTTRRSNKSDSGGGAIYGCRAKAGTESCVAANNLHNGDVFRFQATPSAATVGQIRFGQNPTTPVDKPPFTTNGTGLVKNLDADRVDGKSAEDFLPAGSMLFAVVGADGTIGAARGVPANAKATVTPDAANPTVRSRSRPTSRSAPRPRARRRRRRPARSPWPSAATASRWS